MKYNAESHEECYYATTELLCALAAVVGWRHDEALASSTDKSAKKFSTFLRAQACARGDRLVTRDEACYTYLLECLRRMPQSVLHEFYASVDEMGPERMSEGEYINFAKSNMKVYHTVSELKKVIEPGFLVAMVEDGVCFLVSAFDSGSSCSFSQA